MLKSKSNAWSAELAEYMLGLLSDGNNLFNQSLNQHTQPINQLTN